MVLFITDSISSLNGMSIFSNHFNNWLCRKYNENIIVFEVESNKFNIIKEVNNDKTINEIFVNGHFSKSDRLFRNKHIETIVSSHDYYINSVCITSIISHGWQKVKNRFSIYNVAYNLKNLIRTLNINSISKHYNSIIFISNKCDDYRHYDYKWSIKNNFRFELVDFTKEMFVGNPTTKKSSLKNYILVISNFDSVKNLFLLFKLNCSYKLKKKKKKNFVLLSTKPKTFSGKIIFKLLVFSKVNIIFDQTQKNSLITNCNYLFIPSHTEYLPIVALEAFSMNKSVLSFYYIIGLSEFKKYHFLNK
jgi:hypothetical protein